MKALATESRRKSFFLFSVSLCLRGNFLSRQTYWSWLSLTIVTHSFTAAGLFTVQQHTDQAVRNAQTALLTDLLDAVQCKCNERPAASDIDTMGIANLLWATVKLVGNGQELTPEFKEAVAILLPRVNALKAHFDFQGITNLLWAVVKLGFKGLDITPELKEVLVSLSSCVNISKDHVNARWTACLLWATGAPGDLISTAAVDSLAEYMLRELDKQRLFTQTRRWFCIMLMPVSLLTGGCISGIGTYRQGTGLLLRFCRDKDLWNVALLVGDIRDRIIEVIVGVMMTPVLPVGGHTMSGALLHGVNDIWQLIRHVIHQRQSHVQSPASRISTISPGLRDSAY